MNLYEAITSSDKISERALISRILTTKKIPVGVSEKFFTGNEQKLYLKILDQWHFFGDIDITVLKEAHGEVIEAALTLCGSSSEVVIESLKKAWMRREMARLALSSYELDDPASDLREMIAKASNILCLESEKRYNHNDEVVRATKFVNDACEDSASTTGYKTNIRVIDRYVRFVPGRFYVIGALKKTGKTRFGIYLSAKMKNQGANIMWNTLEMSPLRLNVLGLSHYSGVNSDLLGKGRLDVNNRSKIAETCGMLSELNWVLHSDYYIPDLRSRIMQERTKRPIDVLFVDFIQRMRSKKHPRDRVREVEDVAMDLANLSRELNVCVIAFSQLRGQAEELPVDEIPSPSYFKESHGIGENADGLFVLHNYDRKEAIENFDHSYALKNFGMRIDQRDGESGIKAKFLADLRTCIFRDH